MKKYIIFDNGGKTFDRFTIINKETGDVFGASENPNAPHGVGRCCGNCAHHRIALFGAGWRQRLPLKTILQAEIENYINNAKLNPDWIGREVELERLPGSLQHFIARLDGHHAPGSSLMMDHGFADKHADIYKIQS